MLVTNVLGHPQPSADLNLVYPIGSKGFLSLFSQREITQTPRGFKYYAVRSSEVSQFQGWLVYFWNICDSSTHLSFCAANLLSADFQPQAWPYWVVRWLVLAQAFPSERNIPVPHLMMCILVSIDPSKFFGQNCSANLFLSQPSATFIL